MISRQIANAHTLFNITMTVIWVPLIWLMVKIVMKIIPDGQKKSLQQRRTAVSGFQTGFTADRGTSAGRKKKWQDVSSWLATT